MRVELSNVPEHDKGWNICERMNFGLNGNACDTGILEREEKRNPCSRRWMDGWMDLKKKGVGFDSNSTKNLNENHRESYVRYAT